MAYAKAITFYGWINNDAVEIVQELTGLKITIDDKVQPKIINDKLDKADNIHFDNFKGGLSSNEFIPIMYLGKKMYCESANSDDIDIAYQELNDMKELLNISFIFHKKYIRIKKPKLFTLVVSDEK